MSEQSGFREASVSAAPTLAARVFAQLRRDILACVLMPNEKLRLDALRQHYGVGATPLREALSRLAGQRLVVSEGQRGFRVAPVSADDLDDITNLRCEIEPLALRLSIARGDDRWEARVIGAFHHLSLMPRRRWKPGDAKMDEWNQRHAAFHHALIDHCGSPRLLAIRETLFDHAQRYQRLWIAFGETPRDDEKEHRDICQAALARDAEAAGRLTIEHIADTARLVRETLGRENTIRPAEAAA